MLHWDNCITTPQRNGVMELPVFEQQIKRIYPHLPPDPFIAARHILNMFGNAKIVVHSGHLKWPQEASVCSCMRREVL